VTANYAGKTTSAVVNFRCNNLALDLNVAPGEIPADGASTANITIKVKDDSGFVSPLEEKILELHTTLGRVQSPVKWPAKAQSVNATLTAGEVGGTAVVTALLGSAKGEGKVELKGAAKRFCMHCGASMSLEAAQCPKCGLTPPSGVDTKQCNTCNTVIPEAAKYCYSCGNKQPEIKK